MRQRREPRTVTHVCESLATWKVVPHHVLVVVLTKLTNVRNIRCCKGNCCTPLKSVLRQPNAHSPPLCVIDRVIFPKGCLPKHPHWAQCRRQVNWLDRNRTFIV